jgi:hypothetical protein
MAWGRTKTEHCGPKRGKGHWGRKAVAKETAKRSRRREDRLASDSADDRGSANKQFQQTRLRRAAELQHVRQSEAGSGPELESAGVGVRRNA